MAQPAAPDLGRAVIRGSCVRVPLLNFSQEQCTDACRRVVSQLGKRATITLDAPTPGTGATADIVCIVNMPSSSRNRAVVNATGHDLRRILRQHIGTTDSSQDAEANEEAQSSHEEPVLRDNSRQGRHHSTKRSSR